MVPNALQDIDTTISRISNRINDCCAEYLISEREEAIRRKTLMPSPKEFREFALECLRRADQTREERIRQILLNMAAHSMRAAVQVERATAVINEEQSFIPKKDT